MRKKLVAAVALLAVARTRALLAAAAAADDGEDVDHRLRRTVAGAGRAAAQPVRGRERHQDPRPLRRRHRPRPRHPRGGRELRRRCLLRAGRGRTGRAQGRRPARASAGEILEQGGSGVPLAGGALGRGFRVVPASSSTTRTTSTRRRCPSRSSTTSTPSGREESGSCRAATASRSSSRRSGWWKAKSSRCSGSKDLKANNPRTYPNNLAALQAVANREIDVAFLNHYYLYRFLAERGEGFTARNYFFDNGDLGGLFLVSGAAVLESSDNKEAAEKFVRVPARPSQAQQYFAEHDYEYPVARARRRTRRSRRSRGCKAPDIDLSDLGDLRGLAGDDAGSGNPPLTLSDPAAGASAGAAAPWRTLAVSSPSSLARVVRRGCPPLARLPRRSARPSRVRTSGRC